MTHSHRRCLSRNRRSGQILLIAVLLMIVIAVIGSTFAAIAFSTQIHPATLAPAAQHQTIA